MAPLTPYTTDLEGRDPVQAMERSAPAIERLTMSWTPEEFERASGPGKWSARQILTHLAQTELALGSRARMALSMPGYVAQNFDQDAWMAKEANLPGRDAVAALVAISRMNVSLFRALSDAERRTAFSHPEYGALTVDWVIHQMAGHQIHHLTQLQHIAQR